MIIPTLLILGFSIVFYYTIWRPFTYYVFYRRNKNTKAIFVPIVSTFPSGRKYVDDHHDYYHGILQEKKRNPNLKVYGRNIGSTYMLYMLDPIYTQDLFMSSDSVLQKHHFQNAWVKTLAPFGLVLSEGTIWKKHRKLFGKGFSHKRVQQSLKVILASSQQKIGRLKHGQSISTMNYFKQIAGGILSQVFFNFNANDIVIDNIPFPLYLSQLISDVSCESYSYLFSLFGINVVNLQLFKEHRQICQRIHKMREAVRKTVRKYVEMRKGSLNGQQNMWDLFINNEQPFSEDQIVDEFITFFSDGVYTSGHFMMMACYYLANNPQWQIKIRNELNNIQAFNKQQTLSQLENLKACILETFRLAPPVVTGIQRIVLQDTVLSNQYHLKKGTMVMACHIVNHLDEAYHDQPFKFNPQRWISPSKTQESVKKYPGLFIPFSIGLRNCPGQHFAKSQGSIFLGLLIKKFNISMQDNSYKLKFCQKFLREPQYSFNITLSQVKLQN